MTSTAPIAVLADSDAYTRAVGTAAAARAAHRAGGAYALDDATYDALLRGIERYEAGHPGEVLPNSPTRRPAGQVHRREQPRS
ncbi:hypothetical protein OG689_33690 [Kitasatospora sp. NBC_00240]|uniref:hypothetical protein n=1 Tax=Kitasatospora sp. NBC_00240 TaxID=2903567 RepID=UPI00224F558C|nr:hypothetical protein [Kitasatospora sp. NBC_00240]MCX5214157.1 hypothetical protein [Kitasatospora sp. NBC_00240]